MSEKELQKIIDSLFTEPEDNPSDSTQSKVINSSKYKVAIQSARQKIGAEKIIPRNSGLLSFQRASTKLNKLNDEELIELGISLLLKNSAEIEEKEQARSKYFEIVEEVIKKVGLTDDWTTYIAVNIVKPFPPQTRVYSPNRYIVVDECTKNSVTMTLKSGLRYQEYMNAWKYLSKSLGKGRRKKRSLNEATAHRDLQLYGKREFYGLTHKQLAEEYINPSINLDDAKDIVKKAIKRQKKIHDEGTDFTK